MTIPSFILELIIALVLGVVPLYLLELGWRWKRMPYRGRHVIVAALLVIVWSTVFYGSFIETRKLDVVRSDIVLGEEGKPLRIALLSDTHFGMFRHADWAQKLVETVNAQEPDVIVLAGDLVSNVAGMTAFTLFAGFESTYGTYAVLGNTDYRVGAVDVRHRIESYGIEVLTNESVSLDVEGTSVRLIGIDDMWYGIPNWDQAIAEVEDDAVTIVASHNPDAAPVAEFYGMDLVLAGHTHGGQIRLPYIGSIAKLPITIDQHFDEGLFNFGPTQLFITSGTGESGTRARLFNPPEIAILDVVL